MYTEYFEQAHALLQTVFAGFIMQYIHFKPLHLSVSVSSPLPFSERQFWESGKAISGMEEKNANHVLN
jgi:hypothetical protein